jgi:predicted nucleotidyltransferase
MLQKGSEPEHQDPVLEKLLSLAGKKSDISALWLYGSRAKGNYQPTSDYDIALSFANRLPDTLENRLRPETLSSEWSQLLAEDISVVDIDLIPTPLAAAISDEGLLLLDKAPVNTAWLYNKIWSKWDEWQYNRRANQQ